MSKPAELIYIGNCKDIIEDLEKSANVIIRRSEIKEKKGTRQLIFPVQEWLYYPLSFECKDNIYIPKGKYIAGDFRTHNSFENYGYIKKAYGSR